MMLKTKSLKSSLDSASNGGPVFEIKLIFEQIFEKIILLNFDYLL